jgi:DNA-binding CsgD family transcriptional regulator/tetratricopeptide (TPR) repeat protein
VTSLARPVSGARFVGRAPELVVLTDALASAAVGATTAVFVGGEGGVGKSRLIREFAERARRVGSRVLTGGCIGLAVGELPYAPLAEVLRGLVRELGGQTVREIAGRGYPALHHLVPFLDDDDQGDPGHGTGTGGSGQGEGDGEPRPDGPASQARLFEAVLRLLARLAEQAPLVVVIEDLQWADRSTLDLLSFLATTMTQDRLLLVASYRSNDLQPGHPLRRVLAELGRSAHTRRLELAPFTEDELADFLTAALGDGPAPVVVRQIFELSDGNAYFAEELAAAGALPVPAGERAPLPRSVRDVVLARVEVLPADARDVLHVVAAAGRTIRHPLLAAVFELPEDRLTAALRACVDNHVLATDPAEGTYLFRHALGREVVYEELMPGERAGLHRALAAALAERPALSTASGPMFVAELAHHWYEADDLSSALAASFAAASATAYACAFAESQRQYQRVLTLWERVADPAGIAGASRREVLERGAAAARWAGQITAAIAWLEEALREITPSGPAAERAAVWERLGRYRWEAGDGEGSLSAYEQAVDALAAEPPSGLRAGALAGLATANVQAGRYAVGLRLASEAVRMARSAGARAAESRALTMAGVALTMSGDHEEGVRSLRAALRIAEEIEEPEGLFRAYSNLVFALEKSGLLEDALLVARRGLERSRDIGVELTGGGVLLTNLAAILSLLGRWDEVVEIATDAFRRDVPAGFAMYLHLFLAEIDIARGRFVEAERRLAVLREMSPRLRESQFEGQLHGHYAALAVWRRQFDTARAAVRDGLAVVSEDTLLTLHLCSWGLRAEADRATLGPPRRRRGADTGDSAPSAESGNSASSAESGDSAPSAESGKAGPVPRRPTAPGPARLTSPDRADVVGAGTRPAGPAPDTPADAPDGSEAAAELTARVAAVADDPSGTAPPDVVALRLLCDAEQARIHGRDTPAQWRRVAEQWERLGRPHPTAYARWREGAAALDHRAAGAAPALREAERLAGELGAQPLRQEVAALAGRARIDLGAAPAQATARGGPDGRGGPGLTPRERQVLRHLVAGSSNRIIARRLFIAEKTVSVHVSNILAKLSAASRGEAAAIALRLGLVSADPDGQEDPPHD